MPKIISKDVIEQIRNANDVAEVIGSYFQLKRAGGSFKALCPFHKEKSPSFHVNPQRQIYHCFGCGAGGDVFRFIMQYENVDFGTAARILGERVGMRIEWSEGDGGADSNKGELYKIHEEVAAIYQRALLEMDAAQRARAYLKERDLGDDVVRDFLIGYAPDRRDSLVQWSRKKKLPLQLLEAAGLISHTEDGQPYDRFRNRLMFSIRDELGRVIAFSGRIMEKDVKVAKYVNSPETPLFRKGRVLYALDRARRNIMDARTAILCEGQIDVIRCHMAGFTTAVASQGTALTEDHARLLKRYADSVVVVLDASGSMTEADAPGPRIAAAKTAAHALTDALPDDADLALLDAAAGIVERLHPRADKIRPRDVVAEIAATLAGELDLQREAANASVLRRFWDNSPDLHVPEVVWSHTAQRALIGGRPLRGAALEVRQVLPRGRHGLCLVLHQHIDHAIGMLHAARADLLGREDRVRNQAEDRRQAAVLPEHVDAEPDVVSAQLKGIRKVDLPLLLEIDLEVVTQQATDVADQFHHDPLTLA